MAPNPPLLATLDGYAVEGGYDVAGGIATCYSPAIALGRVTGPGEASHLWDRYEATIDQVAELGLDGIRLTVEWARVEPRAGQIDEAAWHRYGQVIRHASQSGLHVTIALVDAVWPAWLGAEAWLLPWVAEPFAHHLDRVTQFLGEQFDGVVPFTQLETFVEQGYLRGAIPPWRRRERLDAAEARRSLTTLEAMVSRHAILGPKVVRDWQEIPARLPSSAWPAVVADARRASEVHVKSLVRGAGPTMSTAGLVEWRNGVPELSAPLALLNLWRS